jgi:nucleoside-diphosphate kinase
MSETTLVILKPDALERRLAGEILTILERAGLQMSNPIQYDCAPRSVLEEHYQPDEQWLVAVGRKTLDAYERSKLDARSALGTDSPREIGNLVREWLIKDMQRGPIWTLKVIGNQAVTNVRRLVGKTIPADADPATIRGRFGVDSPEAANAELRPVRNLIHASSSLEDARREVFLWYKPT